MTSAVTHIAAAVAVGSVGAAFGSISAALVDLYRHRCDRPRIPRPPHVGERSGRLYAIYDQVKFWAALAAGMAFTLGVVLFTGGPRRVSGSAYHGILTYGGPMLWGAAFIACSIITWACVWRFNQMLGWAMLLQALPFAGIATMFAISAIQYPDANITAAPIYSWIMIMHACLADYCRREY